MLQKFATWIPGAFMLALMSFAGVGPREAASNLSEWASIMGMDSVPSWLATKSADAWGFWIGLLGLVIWIAVKWGPGLWSKIHSKAIGSSENMSIKSPPTSPKTGMGAALKIKHTDGAANRRYMRFEGDRSVCTWYLEIVNESYDIDAQDVEVKVESYDQIPDLLSPHAHTGAFTPVGIILAFERGGNTRSIRRHDSEWLKFISFDRQVPKRWIQIGEYEQSPLDLHGKILQVHTPHRLALTIRAANESPVTAHFLVQAENEMLRVQRL